MTVLNWHYVNFTCRVPVNTLPANRPTNGFLGSDVGLHATSFWKGWDVLVSMQLIQRWMLTNAQQTTRAKLDTTLTGLIRRNFLYDSLTAELLVIANINNGNGIVRSKISYAWQDNLNTWIVCGYFLWKLSGCFWAIQ